MILTFFRRAFCTERSVDEVTLLLESIRNRTITDAEWDSFVSETVCDPRLEKIRQEVEKMWTEDSPFIVPKSLDPTDLNPKGIARINQLIDSVNSLRSS